MRLCTTVWQFRHRKSVIHLFCPNICVYCERGKCFKCVSCRSTINWPVFMGNSERKLCLSVYHVLLYDVQSNVWNDFHIICLSYYALSEAKKSLSPPIHSPIAWVGSTRCAQSCLREGGRRSNRLPRPLFRRPLPRGRGRKSIFLRHCHILVNHRIAPS